MKDFLMAGAVAFGTVLLAWTVLTIGVSVLIHLVERRRR